MADVDVQCIAAQDVLAQSPVVSDLAQYGLDKASELLEGTFADLLAHNPYVLPTDPVAFIGWVDGKVVSQMLAMPDLLCRGKETFRWFWGQSFITYREARGKGIGTQVVARMLDILQARNIAYGAYAMSPMSRRVWDKTGMRYMGRVNRYASLLSLHPLLRYLRFPVAPRRCGRGPKVAPAGLHAVLGRLRGHRTADYHLEPVETFDTRLDIFLAERSGCEDGGAAPEIYLHRNAASLNWRLNFLRERRPKDHVKAVYLLDARHVVQGYFILKLSIVKQFGGKTFAGGLRLVSVLDFRAASENAMVAVLIMARKEAKLMGGEFFEIMNSHARFQKTARRLGFFVLGGYEIAFETPRNWIVRDLPKDQWWLTTGESDAFFF